MNNKKKLNFENYYKELRKIINNTPNDTKTKKYYINDDMSNLYLKKTYNLYLKYKNTDDIELKNHLDYIKNFFKYKIYLYQIICSYYNFIIINYTDYKNEKSKRKRTNLINDYNRIIRTIITRLKLC